MAPIAIEEPRPIDDRIVDVVGVPNGLRLLDAQGVLILLHFVGETS